MKILADLADLADDCVALNQIQKNKKQRSSDLNHQIFSFLKIKKISEIGWENSQDLVVCWMTCCTSWRCSKFVPKINLTDLVDLVDDCVAIN